ncbi:MAG: fumarate reductase subunit C [Candidatus Dadabacteria bacterium]|nr:fumarate reductase subunit C [Candidatus Dadabacteria bacterium]
MKPYHRHVANTWWLKRLPYFLFIVRELTSVFVAAYSVFLLFVIYKIGQGPEAYEGVIELLKSPVVIILHVIVLGFAVYHSITWFNLTPKIFVLWLGEVQIPPFLVAGAHYFAWLVISALVAWIILRA